MLKQGQRTHRSAYNDALWRTTISNVPAVLASITKGGLTAATRGLAIEYASKGIRVNAVAPGMIKSPMHALRHTKLLDP